MFNHVRGVIVRRSPSRVVVESSGVGYDLTVSLSTGRRIPPPGSEATVLLHLVVREDELKLVGFADEEERALFRRLIGLSGVGPAMALQILSGMTPQEFILAIERQDAGALKRVKGVGEKTAKRIILEMKGAKTLLPPGEASDLPPGAPAEATAALVALGVPSGEAAARVEKVLREQPGLELESLIRAALR